MARLELADVSKRFDGLVAVDCVSLVIEEGEFVSLLGPSGCGKTTTLGLIAGFLPLDAGRITIGARDVTREPPYRRNTGMVFQNYALFPHMTVAQNVAFGLRMRRQAKAEIAVKVRRALDLVRLPGTADRYPRQLSGGQQQRIALARALVIEPQILLLDEPLSNLDAKLREEMRLELRDIQRRVGITTVFVTHDQSEALALSDRIAVMNHGTIAQVGSPSAIYDRPASEFVASFIGQTNRLRGEMAGTDGRHVVLLVAGAALRGVVGGGASQIPRADRATALVRPEKIDLGREAVPGRNALPGRVEHSVYLGVVIHYVVATSAGRIAVVRQNAGAPVHEPGSEVVLSWEPEHMLVLPEGVPA
jgi:putative spermidine/putrescine transport system ATP-binding protein